MIVAAPFMDDYSSGGAGFYWEKVFDSFGCLENKFRHFLKLGLDKTGISGYNKLINQEQSILTVIPISLKIE